MARKKDGGNPDNKRRSTGDLLGSKDAQRQGKHYKAKGEVSDAKKITRAGREGQKDLVARRIWRGLFGGED